MTAESILHGIYFHGLKLSPATLALPVTYYQKPAEAKTEPNFQSKCENRRMCFSNHKKTRFLDEEAIRFLPYIHLCRP